MITLTPLAAQDFARVAHIRVQPDQEIYSGTVAEAFEAADPNVDLHAILAQNHPVGFFKLDRTYADQYPFAEPGDLGLRAYMIDAAEQGRGYGSAALHLLPAFAAHHYPHSRAIWLTVNHKNPAAYACYLKGGFYDTGQTWPHGAAGPQYILHHPLLIAENIPG